MSRSKGFELRRRLGDKMLLHCGHESATTEIAWVPGHRHVGARRMQFGARAVLLADLNLHPVELHRVDTGVTEIGHADDHTVDRRPDSAAESAELGALWSEADRHLGADTVVRRRRYPGAVGKADRRSVLDRALEQVGLADEVGNESAGGALIDFLGCADLEQLAVVHDGNAVAHRERLFLVVGDEHEAHPQLALERLEFALHLLTELEVESAERFIEEKHLGFVDERRASATRCCWPPDIWLGLRFSRPAMHEADGLGSASPCLGLGHLPHAQPEGDIVEHVHVRKQGVVLEDGVHRPLVGRQRADLVAEDFETSLGGELEPGDHAKCRRLAAARGAQHCEELAVLNGEVDMVDSGHVAEALRDTGQLNSSSHQFVPHSDVCSTTRTSTNTSTSRREPSISAIASVRA